MKKLAVLFVIFFTTLLFSQKVTLNIKNGGVNTKILFKTLNNKVLKKVSVKDENFDADIDLEEGYYLLQKGEDELLLYLKRTDDIVINFEADDFYNTIVFKGKGSERNTFLLNKKLAFVDKKGVPRNYYKKSFYEGSEKEYSTMLDNYYKSLYDNLFSSGFDKKFIDAEMKNMQYGYSVDLLKFEGAKKYYKFNSSVKVSNSFLEPLNYVHFDKSELVKRFYSYKSLAVLKWKKDIENSTDIKMMQEVFKSIQTESIREGVLESLYKDMTRENLLSGNYYKLIKVNSSKYGLLSKAKAKYEEIRGVVAQKNLSKISLKNIVGERVSLAQFKGNYIFIGFWMSWCSTCVETFKKLKKLKKKYKKDNIVFVGISLDKDSKFGNWKTMIKENGIEYNQFFFRGSKPKIVSEFKISSLPTYRILSLKGKVLEYQTDNPISKETKKIIDKLLKEQ